jgi:hypothetical protein
MARGKKKSKGNSEFDPEEFKDEYLSRFVKDSKNAVKGETIGFEGKDLILKKDDDFFRVPMISVQLEGDFLRLVKDVNWKKAEKGGEKWRKRELDPL